MDLLKLIRTIERHRQWPWLRTYKHWLIGRTNDPDQWKQMYPRRSQSQSLLFISANSAHDAEAVVHHFQELGMTGQLDRERRGRHVYVYYWHPSRGRTIRPRTNARHETRPRPISDSALQKSTHVKWSRRPAVT